MIELKEAHTEINNLKKELKKCCEKLQQIRGCTKDGNGDLYTVSKVDRKYVVKLSCLLREIKVDLTNMNMKHNHEDEETFIECERKFNLAFAQN